MTGGEDGASDLVLALSTAPDAEQAERIGRALVPRLKERLPLLHPYEVPELVVTPLVDGLDPYCRWVRDETDG